ncbi:MAG: TetR/AcrR family transcriptional regulator [Anaerolineales bacterium]|jgi:AcrR family transcriptional regulator
MSEQTQRRILKTAQDLFLEHGYENVSLRDVSEGAGVTKGGIYHHFESKDELLLEVMTNLLSMLGGWYETAIAQGEGVSGILRALLKQVAIDLKRYFARIPGGFGGGHYVLLFGALRRIPSLQQSFREAYARMVSWIETLIDEGKRRGEVRPEANGTLVAMQIGVLIEGMSMMLAFEPRFEVTAVAESLAELVISGIET